LKFLSLNALILRSLNHRARRQLDANSTCTVVKSKEANIHKALVL